MICVLTGAVHGGKTRAATAVVESARAAGQRVMGVLCPGRMRYGVRTSIDAEDLATGKRVRLASRRSGKRDGLEGLALLEPVVPALRDLPASGRARAGRFSFQSRGLMHGRRALRRAIRSFPDVVVIDEIGPLELSGQGWRAPSDLLVSAYRDCRSRLLVLVVRERLLQRVCREWRLNPFVVHADDPRAADRILARPRFRAPVRRAAQATAVVAGRRSMNSRKGALDA